jgi:hypothetical protein
LLSPTFIFYKIVFVTVVTLSQGISVFTSTQKTHAAGRERPLDNALPMQPGVGNAAISVAGLRDVYMCAAHTCVWCRVVALIYATVFHRV